MRELLATIGADELSEWEAYERIEPWGEWRDDQRAAMICLTVYSMLRSKTAPTLSMRDFQLEFSKGRKGRSLESMAAVLRAATAVAGGAIEGG